MTTARWEVHKFGGTSLRDAEAFQRVADIVTELGSDRIAVVVSAMAGTTDRLLALCEAARQRDPAYLVDAEAVVRRQVSTARRLLTGAELGSVTDALTADLADLRDLLRAVWLGRAVPTQTRELISGYGELWSSRLLAAYLRTRGVDAGWTDAREVLVVRSNHPVVVFDWQHTADRLTAHLADRPAAIRVITGFVASTPDGVPTTLTRNGSDLSASVFAALLGATSLTIWTDVDGAMSADPRHVPEAVVLDELSYDEAMELAYFGASVLHPQTMLPAIRRSIPIRVRNTFAPHRPGTHIGPARPPTVDVPPEDVAKGFSSITDIALLNVEGSGMVGLPGIAERLFAALRRVEVSVILISQASSEHSICLAVPDEQAELARITLEEAFFQELRREQIQRVEVVPDCAILAMVGDDMVHTPGVAARFFGALGKAGVNVRAIAQGSSERNISVVIDEREATRALQAVHSGFYLSDQTLSVGVIGPGLVGSTLLEQLRVQVPILAEQLRIDLRVRALMDTGHMLLSDGPLDLASWRDSLRASTDPPDWDRFVDHVQTDRCPHAVIVDCSASGEVASHYQSWLERGVHVVTPNKKANTGSLATYRRLRALGRKPNTHYLYEATVGAGLPVITTLRDLIQTGDRLLSIEGVFSGTLAYVFNVFDGSTPFSAIIRDARARGYTEPDPRDDLSGMDVARKVVILAREMGLPLDLDQVQVQSLVPEPLRHTPSAEVFLEHLPEFDQVYDARLAEARARGEVLRYVGVVDPAGASRVELRGVAASHPFARLTGSDNILAFRTTRYDAQPLIVQGPGAGPEVTAGGVFADLLRLAAYLGAPSTPLA